VSVNKKNFGNKNIGLQDIGGKKLIKIYEKLGKYWYHNNFFQMNTQPSTLHSAIHRIQDTCFLGAYTFALRQNAALLHGKTCLVLGDGVGLLSIVAAQAGCSKVYALENSDLADDIPLLAASNGVGDKVVPVRCKVGDPKADEIISEKVDIVLAMPLSLLCLHDSPLQELVTARDRWLKKDGILVPRQLSIFMAPLTDGGTHAYLKTQADFWDDTNFFGIDFSKMKEAAYLEHFSQPMSGQIDQDALMCKIPNRFEIDLTTKSVKELNNMTMPFLFRCDNRGIAHGFGFWFELRLGLRAANGESVVRSGPSTGEAQWYTCRMIMPEKMSVTPSTTIVGEVNMATNPIKSYDFQVKARIEVKASRKVSTSTHTFSLNNHSCSAMGSMGDEDDWSEAQTASATDVSATWYIGLNGEQQGPFNEEQIEKLIRGGNTTAATYVWRDGMVDWKAIGSVDVFKHHFGHSSPPNLKSV
jgi:histone-arginine methyltransferase CARM1